LQWGNAVEHNIYSFDICRAICCIMAITGNLDVPGGNVQPVPPPVIPPHDFARFDAIPNRDGESISSVHSIVPHFPRIPPTFLIRAVLSKEPYQIRAAYIQASDPIMAWASSRETLQALESLDFLCVSELFMSPTAALADLVLPVATHFEFNDIGHYGLPHGYVLTRPKIVDAPPHCWPDMKILNELAKHLGLGEQWWEDSADIVREILSPANMTYREFDELRILKGEQIYHKYKTNGFPTLSGKVELRSDVAVSYGLPAVPVFNGFPEPEDPAFPLLLSSAKNPHYFHSAYRQLSGLRKRVPMPLLTINPRTAQEIGVVDGEPVQLETRQGRITLTAAISDSVDPRVVYAEHGWYFPERPESKLFDCMRSNFNVLTSNERLGQAFGTPNLRAIPCRISKI
jgi:anaerobic selenocysteine-containing dehydrogenase